MPQLRNSNAPAGPGAAEDSGISPDAALDGADEYEYVTVHNPLSVEFIGQVGISRPINVPFQVRRSPEMNTLTRSEEDVARNYGLDLKNKDYPAKVHLTQKVHIPAGQTVNLLGNEAQVVVRQLVNEIMQRDGMRLMVHDKYQRSLVEGRVIIARRSVNDILGSQGLTTVQTQLQNAVNELNKQEVTTDGTTTEQPFPSLNRPSATDAGLVEPIELVTPKTGRRGRRTVNNPNIAVA